MLTTIARDPRRLGLLAAGTALAMFAAQASSAAEKGTRRADAKTVRASADTATAAIPQIRATVPSSFKTAIEHARRGDERQAMAAAASLSDPVAKALVEWLLIRGGTIDRDYARIASFARSHAHWPAMTLVRRRAEAALYKAAPSPETILTFFNGNPPSSAEGRLALAGAYLARGERARAGELARFIWQRDPLSEGREKEIVASFGEALRPEDHRARYSGLLFREEAGAGLRAAQRLGGGDLALAKAWAAAIRRDKNAAALLDAVPAEYKKHSGFLLSLLRHLRREDRFQDAMIVLAKAPREAQALGDSDEWWEERRIIARHMLDKGDPASAYTVASQHVGESPVERAESEFMAGWLALRFLKRPDLAEGHFTRLSQDVATPISLARAYYWLGRTAEARGAGDQARQRYAQAARHGATFYGQLALNKIGRTKLALPPAPQPTSAERSGFANYDLVRAARLLASAGQNELAISFLSALVDHFGSPGTLALLCELANEIGEPRHAVMVGKKATQKGQPLETYAYPISALPRYTPVREIEPALVFAIARQESVFDAKAVSPVGARGLMQLMPGTAKMMAKAHRMPYTPARLTGDPAYNLQLGSAFLADLVDDYRGNYIMAFAAYNAGPGRVREWINKYGDPRTGQIDPIDWIERIPFTETRNYVQRVMENMQVYRARLNSGAPLQIERDLRRGSEG